MKYFAPALLLSAAPLIFTSVASADELVDLLHASLDHPGVMAKRHQAAAAVGELQAVTARYLGQGAVFTGYQRFDEDRVVGVYVPVPGEPPTLSDTTARYGVNYSIPVDLFGAIKAARRRAESHAELKALAARQEALLKLHQVTAAYARLYALEHQTKALERLDESLHASHRRLENAFAKGQAAGIDLLAIESELAGVQARKAAINGAMKTARADLWEASEIHLAQPIGALPLPEWSEAATPTLPLQLAEAKRAASAAGAEEFRRTLLPSISIDTSYYAFQGGGDTNDTWEVGARVTMPIAASGWRRGGAQRREVRAAESEHAAAQRESQRQLTSLHSTYHAAREDMAALQSEIRFREQVLAVQRERWRVGAQTLENLLRHERDLLDAQYRLSQSTAQALTAWSAAQVLAGVSSARYIAKLERSL